MNGKKANLLTLIKGSDGLLIPVYQRNYDWTVAQCQQLFNDLIEVIRDKHEHFFGSIVSVELDNGGRLIIDGQQRLATVSILLVALKNLLESGKLNAVNKKLASKIFLYYIFSDEVSDENKTKLQLIETDQVAFLKLFEGVEQQIRESNITRNYNFFCDHIPMLNVSADDIFNAVKQLSIIDITLDESDDAQKIFESLNSTGLDLNEGDKIRNFILMNLSPEQQKRFYNEYWHRIEKLTKSDKTLSYNVSGFVRDYLTVKTNKIPNESNIYVAFKKYKENIKLSIEELLVDMLKYARYYKAIKSARTSSERANEILRRFHVLQVTVSIPYFLAVFDYYSEQKISEDDLVEVLIIIESFILRRLVCDLPSNEYNKKFPSLHKEVLKYKTRYVDALKYVMTTKSSNGRFPTDDEFLIRLEEKDVISMRTHNKKYLIARLESGDAFSTLLDRLLENEYVIEQIMPANLSSNWKRELGVNAVAIHSMWSNRLANLTIIDAEDKASGLAFKDKRVILSNPQNGSLRLNKSVSKYQKWTEWELRQRNEMLKTWALELWQYPKTDFCPTIKENETYKLDDGADFTGRMPLSYSFLGDRYPVKNWTELLVQVLRLIYGLDSSHLHIFANDHPSFYPNRCKGAESISNNLYVNTLSSTNQKIKLLQSVFEYCGFNGEDLEIELKSVAN